MALMEKFYLTLPEALWHYSAKVLVMLFPSTANYSHIAMKVVGAGTVLCHLNFSNFAVARLNPKNKAKKVNFRPYHATTSNS